MIAMVDTGRRCQVSACRCHLREIEFQIERARAEGRRVLELLNWG